MGRWTCAPKRQRTRELYPHQTRRPEGFVKFTTLALHWPILILSGVLEAVWAAALAASDRFRKPVPTVIFLVGLLVSMAGLAYAMTGIPTGTAYAVWVGIGAALAVTWSMVTGVEKATRARVLLLLGLVLCVVGLKVVA